MENNPATMWDAFMSHMAKVDPIGKPDKDGNPPLHKNFVGGADKYRKLFIDANTPAESTEPRMKPYCPSCGSDRLVKDATAIWSPEKNDWVLADVFDNVSCDDCSDYKIRNPDWKPV